MSIELRTRVRDAADLHPRADPRELACVVANEAPIDQLRVYLTEALVDYVASVLRQSRNSAMSDNNPPETAHNRTPGPSKKIARRREWWANLLAQRVHVGDTAWKTLADCTIADLRFCVQERETNVDRLRGQIAHYEKLVALMDEYGAPTVNALPPQREW